jgi:hypothetical protein
MRLFRLHPVPLPVPSPMPSLRHVHIELARKDAMYVTPALPQRVTFQG